MTRSPTSSPAARSGAATARQGVGAGLLLAAAGGALWYAWLGWDTTYDADPVTGRLSGPYSRWQVAGFVLSAAALVLAARRFVRPLILVPAVAAGIAGGFALSARADDSGLALIGVVLILAGSAAGTALLLALARLLAGPLALARRPAGSRRS